MAADPAVELEDLAGDVREAIELKDEAGGVGGRVEGAEGVGGEHSLAVRFEDDAGHLGFQEAGEHAIATNAPGSVFAGDGLCEGDEASLGCGVIGLTFGACEGCEGADIDDVPGALAGHELDGCTSASEGTAEIDVDDLIPGLGGHERHGLVAHETCVVDEQVDSRQRLEELDHGSGAADIECRASGREDVPPGCFQARAEGEG